MISRVKKTATIKLYEKLPPQCVCPTWQHRNRSDCAQEARLGSNRTTQRRHSFEASGRHPLLSLSAYCTLRQPAKHFYSVQNGPQCSSASRSASSDSLDSCEFERQPERRRDVRS